MVCNTYEEIELNIGDRAYVDVGLNSINLGIMAAYAKNWL